MNPENQSTTLPGAMRASAAGKPGGWSSTAMRSSLGRQARRRSLAVALLTLFGATPCWNSLAVSARVSQPWPALTHKAVPPWADTGVSPGACSASAVRRACARSRQAMFRRRTKAAWWPWPMKVVVRGREAGAFDADHGGWAQRQRGQQEGHLLRAAGHQDLVRPSPDAARRQQAAVALLRASRRWGTGRRRTGRR